MKADDARNRTQSAITKKKEAEAATEQKRLKELEDARKKAKDQFDDHYSELLAKIVETADGGKNSTSWTFVATLDQDGSHGPQHAFETELAKLAVRKLKADGYVVNQTTKMDRVKDHTGEEHQAVCIDVEISW